MLLERFDEYREYLYNQTTIKNLLNLSRIKISYISGKPPGFRDHPGGGSKRGPFQLALEPEVLYGSLGSPHNSRLDPKILSICRGEDGIPYQAGDGDGERDFVWRSAMSEVRRVLSQNRVVFRQIVSSNAHLLFEHPCSSCIRVTLVEYSATLEQQICLSQYRISTRSIQRGRTLWRQM